MKIFLRLLLFGLLALVVIIGILWVWVDRKGARYLREARAMLEKNGQSLNFRDVMPEPIPDAENFCAIPLLKDLAVVIDDDPDKGEPAIRRKRLSDTAPHDYYSARWRTMARAEFGERADLEGCAAWLREKGSRFVPGNSGDVARDILAGFSKQEPVFAELAAGLARERAQWTPAWRTRELPRNPFQIQLPHLSSVIALDRSLEIRSIAAARSGDIVKAHEAAQIMARLNLASLDEPFIGGFVLAMDGAMGLADVTWELCNAQAGTAKDFRTLESALAALQFREAAVRAVCGEMICGLDMLRIARDDADQHAPIFGPIDNHGRPLPSIVLISPRTVPAGILDGNAAILAEREFVYLIEPLRDRGWPEAVASSRELMAELERVKREISAHTSRIVARSSFIVLAMSAPGEGTLIYRALHAQSRVNQATVACALERYRIEKGSYPESLEELKLTDGKALPLDIMTGKAIGYRQTPNGKYALWSTALNGKDHGGKRVLDAINPERTGFYRESYVGDWVWDFPEK